MVSQNVAGGHSAGDTPVPISNTVVKLCRADGTAEGTWWESTSLPAHSWAHPFLKGWAFLLTLSRSWRQDPLAPQSSHIIGRYVVSLITNLYAYVCDDRTTLRNSRVIGEWTGLIALSFPGV